LSAYGVNTKQGRGDYPFWEVVTNDYKNRVSP
jgi:hypothetical protein